ncbi:hypothetical protein LHP98_13405 [Rhodobacter sp. Har01]|uniref:TsoY family (seleno)protein n=1 Tax=Rhodobacter sp. Har01 TaxID=2883999 RepID=UPI001D091EB8|nr:hypothetical protein [Rhodobacter sp. Har01]MCB6179116.1 hypothetical protein [Rhodobacter sp. Har01]
MCASNAESQLLALPLTLAMAINVGFGLGMVVVPGLRRGAEYLFPAAILTFLAVGVLALAQSGAFPGRVKTAGGFDWTANGSLAQMLPAFALSMVGVSLAAPAAMSTLPVPSAVGMTLATFFLVAAVLVGLVALLPYIHSMLSRSGTPEAAPTILIVIPILTVLGILMLRGDHGMHEHLQVHAAPGERLPLLTKLISAQLVLALPGLGILRRLGYAAKLLKSEKNSVGACALICSCAAFGVLMPSWINAVPVGAGLVTRFSAAYWMLTLVPLITQLRMVKLLSQLNRRHFHRTAQVPRSAPGRTPPAE